MHIEPDAGPLLPPIQRECFWPFAYFERFGPRAQDELRKIFPDTIGLVQQCRTAKKTTLPDKPASGTLILLDVSQVAR
jgi:hypothetical protein